MKKYVVVGSKKIGGSLVYSAAQSYEECQQTIARCEKAPHLAGHGPYKIVLQKDAERQRLYGD